MEINYKKIPLDGVLDSPIDLRDYNYREFCCSNSKNDIPDEDEVQYPFDARNQLNTSTCAFQSVTAIVETINDVNDYLSEGFLNAMRNECDDVGDSKGAYTRDVMKLACKVGTIPRKDFSSLEDYPKIKELFDSLPNRNKLIEKAKNLKCKSYVRVDIEDIPAYIHNEKKPLIFTVKLYESFYKVNYPGTDGIVPYPSKGKRCGNHAMVCVGYRYINKKLFLKILNSWGKEWCLGGYCWINAEDLDLINEVWGFTDLPKRKPGSKYKIGWDKDKVTNNWIYSEDGKTLFQNGWKQIQNNWYYFKNTFAANGEWIKDNNSWYYFEPQSCNMAQNKWILCNDKWYRFGQDGKMLTEWFQNEHGEWFYLDIDKGYAYSGWVLIHGDYYYFNQDCVMQTGWLKYNNNLYYLEPNSTGHKGKCYIECTKTIDGKDYTFDINGKLIQ